jgi:hypothetical protein
MSKDKRLATEKHIAAAKAVGLILLGKAKTKNKNKKHYQFEHCKHVQDIGIKEVAENRFKCQTCFQIELATRAEAQGLILIGAGRNAAHRKYQFQDCNHTQEITTSNVDKGKPHFSCASCRQRKLLDEASKAGVILRGPGSSFHHRTYTILKCGHTLNLKTQSVREQNPVCKICREKRFICEAEQVGLTLLGEASSALDVSIKMSNYRLYRINECGHEQNFKLSHVREGNYSCDTCKVGDIVQRAYKSGWKYIKKNKATGLHIVQCLTARHSAEIETGRLGHGKIQCVDCFEDRLRIEADLMKLTFLGEADRSLFDANYRHYSCNRCQNHMALRIDHVKQGSFLCEYCDDSHLDFPSNVYLLHITTEEFDWLKLGYAKDITSRIKGYGLSDECSVIILKALPYDTGRSAKRKELSIHAKYKSEYRLDQNYMKQFHKLNGFTECYRIDAKKLLLAELET